MSRKIVYIKKSTKLDKKWMVYVDPPGRTIHFGAAGMSDYTKHKDKSRMKRYLNRHKSRESWKCKDIITAGFWSKMLLWNKPTITASKQDISKKCNVIFRNGWPKLRSKRNSKRSPKRRRSKKKVYKSR